MPSSVRLDSKGIVLAPGELSRAPGALTVADNVNVEAPGIIRSRFGFAKTANGFGGPGWKFVSTKELGSNLLMNYGTNLVAGGLKYGDGSAAATTIAGTYTNQPATRMQTAVCRRNHYLTTDEGVRRIETDFSPWFAGMPKGLPLDLTGPTAVLVNPTSGTLAYDTQTGNFHLGVLVTGGTSGATATIIKDVDNGSTGFLAVTGITGRFSAVAEGLTDTTTGAAQLTAGSAPDGWLADGSSAAYRVTWCKADAQGAIMEGSPAGRVVVYNNKRTTGWVTGLAKNVTCRILLPKATLTASTALTTAYFYRLYRSRAETVGVTPSDDMCVVAEAFLSGTDISNGYVDVVDTTPEAFRTLGAPLYTNPNIGGDSGVGGPGLSQSNDPPPRCRDAALFASCLFYSDLLYPYSTDFTILSTTPNVGLTAADTLTIGGVVYTAVAMSATPSNNQFRVVTFADGATNSEAIERTAQNLIEAINKSSTNTTTWAYYASSPTTLPGIVHLESRVNNATFDTIASAHGTAYRPQLAATLSSTADTFANGYAFSKPAQGDAVPRVNLGFIGRDDTALLRMVVLRDSMFFFTDSGIYRLVGRSFEDFSVQEFDLSFRLVGREMVAVCDDFIYAWGYEGIAKISSAGVEYISNSIEPRLWQIINDAGLTATGTYGWASAYRSRHKVLFGYVDSATGTNKGNCRVILVYDTRMQAWTTWSFTAGTDSDRTTGYSCGAVRVSDDLLFLGQWQNSSGDSNVFKERRTYAASDFKDDTYSQSNQAITKTVTWAAAAGAPGKTTHWDALQLLFDVSSVFTAWTTPTALTAQFTADFASASAANALAPTALSRLSIAGVPQTQRRSERLAVSIVHAVASEYFGLEGLVLVHNPPEGDKPVRT